MRDCVRWSIQNKNKVPLLLLRKILYIQKPCLTLPARHGFWTKSNPFPYRPCRNWRSRKNSKKLWFYEVLSLFTQPNGFIVGTFSDAIPKPLIFLSNSLLCFFQPDKKPCLPLKLITFRISSCIIWCIWCKSRLREWVLQSDYLLNYNLYYWISQSEQKKQRTNFHFKVRHFFLRYWIIKVFIQSIKLGSF